MQEPVCPRRPAQDPLSQCHRQPVPDFLSPDWNVSNREAGSQAGYCITLTFFETVLESHTGGLLTSNRK